MTTLDILILVFCGVGLVMGLYKGFISQLGSIAAIVLGIVACRLWGDAATGVVAGWLGVSDEYSAWSCHSASILGNVILFLVVYILTLLVARVLHRVSHALMLGPLDHVAGAVLGIFKWVFLLSVLVNLWLVLSPGSDIVTSSTLAGGRLAAWITDFAPAILGASIK